MKVRKIFLFVFVLGFTRVALPNGTCEIGIVGGGPAGIYTAYKLAPRYGKAICVFEKEKTLGGRMTDERVSPAENAEWVGTGARRVNVVQKEVLELGKELGIEFQKPEDRTQLIRHKGHWGFTPDDFVVDYPGLIGPLDREPGTNREDEIYELLLAQKEKAAQYPDFKHFVAGVAGANAPDFLRGVSRFHADFDYSVSAANHLEYVADEFATSKINVYPVGGMGRFVVRMGERAVQHGVRLFTSTALRNVAEITGGGYRLDTSGGEFVVKKLILAIPPSGLNYVGGKLVEAVREQPAYRALLPIRIVVINQVWDRPWWDVTAADESGDPKSKIWRAWSSEGCVNHIEIPQEDYLRNAFVTRSVYTDDPACVAHWEKVQKEKGLSGVGAEVVSGLQSLFNFNPRHRVTVPAPVKTTMRLWPAGWYFVRSGTKLTNAEIAQWAVEPLAGRRDLMLVGEAYWPNRPGWSEGAYFSADLLLKQRFAP
jgi:hypothetical protein